ncbi:MAG: hypothetical protein N2258_00325 [Brevinematales bacterium]|nr:hypothetical protein [Brevinematales bacterium]
MLFKPLSEVEFYQWLPCDWARNFKLMSMADKILPNDYYYRKQEAEFSPILTTSI